MDFLISDEELIRFLHHKKTEISSCIEEPLTFLSQLRDHDLVPEDLYQKVIRMKNKERKQKGVYEILDWVENKQGHCVKLFWSCVFQDHILQKYPRLRVLQKRLLDDSFRISARCIKAERPTINTEVQRKEKKQEQKKGAIKRKKCGEETDEEERGPSSLSSQKKPAMKPPHCFFRIPKKLPKAYEPRNNMKVERKEKKQEQKKGATKKSGEETHKEERGPSSVSSQKKPAVKPTLSQLLEKGELPVTCGLKKGTLYKDKLARGKECILSQCMWFTPGDFEKFSGREKSKNWKLSIRCQNITLHKLIQKVRFLLCCVERSSPRQYTQPFIL
ncbi:nuclear body protein SP140-like protein isoform X2 [Ictalurus punctatus]|uniref:Nuclear body protein SP140-like protein isoform X2 n=1 Tax=Ictalurus punctatus TaxID=7998 RepID=A0A9F7RPC1_ICTPU|nr:nuclear body protein SP140-like protein isoform X2 [Ictalurus punctatus]